MKEIHIRVGKDITSIDCGKKLSVCPSPILDEKLRTILIVTIKEVIQKYENGTLDEIALMQAKVRNMFNLKKAMIRGSNN